MSKLVKIFLTILLVVDMVGINLAVGYLLITNFKLPTSYQISEVKNQFPEAQMVDQCGLECQKYIDEKLKLLDDKYLVAGPSGTITPTSKPASVKVVPTRAKTRSVSYVTIPSGGSTISQSWVDLAGTDFYFDPADYSGLVEVYFEANMKLFNGSGMAYARLYDTANGIGVQGSEVQTKLNNDTVVTSGRVSFWAGKNLIRVQIKSLTTESAVYNSGRLRIVTEN